MAPARALWITGTRAAEIRDCHVAEPGDAEVLVETLFSAVSRGTEALVFNGLVPAGEYEAMRAPFQEGAFPAPVKYGYCNVGRVTAGHADLIGQVVFCLHPHQTRYVVPKSAVTPVAPEVPAGRAILAANLETAINALWDGQPGIGDRIAVVGAGAVGCLCAWLASRITGCQVQLIDINPDRADIGNALGVDFRLPQQAAANADLVIHASGSAAGLATAIDLAGFEATVLELSWYGSQETSVPLGGRFHSQRLRILSSQVGHIPPSRRSRWNHGRRLELVMRLLAADELDSLITDDSPFEQLPEVLAGLSQNASRAICHRITYL